MLSISHHVCGSVIARTSTHNVQLHVWPMLTNLSTAKLWKQDKTGAMFFMAVNQAFGMIGPVLGSFPTERGIVLRERMARSYMLSAYYLAKVAPPCQSRARMSAYNASTLARLYGLLMS